jgi:hypothetical protein
LEEEEGRRSVEEREKRRVRRVVGRSTRSKACRLRSATFSCRSQTGRWAAARRISKTSHSKSDRSLVEEGGWTGGEMRTSGCRSAEREIDVGGRGEEVNGGGEKENGDEKGEASGVGSPAVVPGHRSGNGGARRLLKGGRGGRKGKSGRVGESQVREDKVSDGFRTTRRACSKTR